MKDERGGRRRRVRGAERGGQVVCGVGAGGRVALVGHGRVEEWLRVVRCGGPMHLEQLVHLLHLEAVCPRVRLQKLWQRLPARDPRLGGWVVAAACISEGGSRHQPGVTITRRAPGAGAPRVVGHRGGGDDEVLEPPDQHLGLGGERLERILVDDPLEVEDLLGGLGVPQVAHPAPLAVVARGHHDGQHIPAWGARAWVWRQSWRVGLGVGGERGGGCRRR